MHGAWGALTTLIKKQEAAKFRKAKLRVKLQKSKENYLKNNSEDELEFPKISNSEMKVLKQEIRKKYRIIKIKNFILNSIILILVLFLFYYIFNYIK